MLQEFNRIASEGETARKTDLLAFLKIFSLLLLGVASSTLGILYFIKFLKYWETFDGLLSFGFLCLGSVIVILESFFVRHILHLTGIHFLQSIIPLSLFFTNLAPEKISEGDPSIFVLLGGAALYFVVSLSGIISAKHILDNSLRVRFFSAAKPALAKFTTGILIFVSVIFYVSYFQWNYWNESISLKTGNLAVGLIEPSLKIAFPGTNADQSINEFLTRIAEIELQKLSAKSLSNANDDGFNLNSLTPNDRKIVISNTVAKIKESLESQPVVGAFSDTEKVRDVLYRVIKNYVSNLYQKTDKTVFGAISALILFFTLKTTIAVFYWLIELFAFIVYKLLMVLGFAYISFESSRKETIVI